jgi:predicted amidohydrolase YtcJ
MPVGATLKLFMLWVAYYHYEDANRGSIELGKLAGYALIEREPHKISEEESASLKVFETIREGKMFYIA